MPETISELKRSVSLGQFFNAVENFLEEFDLLQIKGSIDELIEDRVSVGYKMNYRIDIKREYKHIRGSGGHRLTQLSLVRRNNDSTETNVLESKHYRSWDTTSDDTTDHTHRHEGYVRLYSNDELGKKVFEILRGQNE